MKVFLAGATGVIGRHLLPLLVRNGHVVTAMTRSHAREEQIRMQGAEPVVCNVFDRDKLFKAIELSKPDAVIHQMTSIPKRIHPRRMRMELAATNRLRTEGTRVIVEAAISAGARRLIAQSIAFAYPPTGGILATEEEPLYLSAPAKYLDVVRAINVCESTVLGTAGIDGIVLRYGYFYGPGTIYAKDGSFAEDVRRRRIPIIGDGGGVFSFVHVNDAASATAAALEYGESGIYNITDDQPAVAREWLPWYAELLGAPHPLRVPKFIGRLGAGPYGIYLLTEQRGALNTKSKQRLKWKPKYSSWRDGFRFELASKMA